MNEFWSSKISRMFAPSQSRCCATLGYQVLEAPDGPMALQILQQQQGSIDLLFTDVVLPAGIDGAALAAQAMALSPQLKVLFTTGYPRNALVRQGRIDSGVDLITQPLMISSWVRAARSGP